MIEVRLGDETIGAQLLAAPLGALSFSKADFAFRGRATRRLQLRFHQRQRGPYIRIVEPGEHLAFADRHSLFHVDLDDLAGDL